MKIYKKSECEMIDGIIVKDGEAVGLPCSVHRMLHIVEEQLQKAYYLLDQPKACPAPTLEGFVKKTSSPMPFIKKPTTPFSDAQVNMALAIMNETDAVNAVNEINDMIEDFKPLIEWVASETLMDSGDCYGKLDLPELGDPLKLTTDDIVEALKAIAKAAEIQGPEY